jgi:hypothetical protein
MMGARLYYREFGLLSHKKVGRAGDLPPCNESSNYDRLMDAV